MELKKYILLYVKEEEIFAHYLNIDISIIQECINYPSDKVNNPLRDDFHPSLSFKYVRTNKGEIKLIAKDFANTFYTGDVFFWVGLCTKLNCNNPSDFIKICYHIISNVLRDKREFVLNTKDRIDKQDDIYDIQDRTWNKNDTRYWEQYNLDYFDVTEAPTILVQQLFKNDELIYNYRKEDPCYGYVSGHPTGNRFKFYFPFRKKPSIRFITNIKTYIEYPMELYRGDTLILTKSRKDVLVLRKLLRNCDFNRKIVVNCFTGEAIRLKIDHVKVLRKIYNDIHVLMDNDIAGIECMQYHKEFGFIPIFLKRSVAKDISEHVSKYKFITTLNLIKEYGKTVVE